jgi:hypothetical protein
MNDLLSNRVGFDRYARFMHWFHLFDSTGNKTRQIAENLAGLQRIAITGNVYCTAKPVK